MTTTHPAADAEYLTEALRASGVLSDGRVRDATIENSQNTILSQIVWLSLAYEGPAD